MKRLFLAASLALVVVALAPIASANAAFKGTCTFAGTAEVPTGLNTEPPENLAAWELQEYKFTAKEEEIQKVKVVAVKCANGAEVEEGNPPEYEATVSGFGKLSCAVSAAGFGETEVEVELPNKTKVKVKHSGAAGTGKLKLPGTGVLEFKFRFVGKGTTVDFFILNAKLETTATGTASFAGDEKAIKECAKKEKPKKLKFTATATGTIG